MFTAPEVVGRLAAVAPATPDDLDELTDLAWTRSLHPALAGWQATRVDDPGTAVVRPAHGGTVIGTISSRPLPGYPDVANVSIFTDTSTARGGAALEAYAAVVSALFDQGARLVHHEVLELNRPIRRIFRGMRLEPSARYRQHGYVAGRLWDVLVYSFDQRFWEDVLDRIPNFSTPRANGPDLTDPARPEGPPDSA